MLLFNEYDNLIYFKQKIYLIKLFLIQKSTNIQYQSLFILVIIINFTQN